MGFTKEEFRKNWNESGLSNEPDLDEETLFKMSDHELLNLRMTGLNSYEEDLVILEMERRGFGESEDE